MAARKVNRPAGQGAAGRLGGAVLGAAAAALRVVALPTAALLVYIAGVWCLWQHAAAQAVRPGNPATVAAACAWLTPADVAELNAAVCLGPRATLYDRRLCRSVARGYAESAWVERVASVRREFPDRIVVDLAIRRPAAYVRSGGRLCLVDREGFRLPVRAARASSPVYPVIEGVRAPLPAVGAQWEGRPVRDALLLAEKLGEALAGRGPALGITDVTVCEEKGAVDGLPQLAARTASGMVIDWGGCAQSSSYLFPSMDEKLRELHRALKDISDPCGVESIMLRYRGCSLKPRDELSRAPGPAVAAAVPGAGAAPVGAAGN